MQTVKFPCTNCNNLMAVGDNLLGKSVRCPHCQTVLTAPATVPAAVGPTEPVFNVPAPVKPAEEGSIFEEQDEEGDDLFGQKADTLQIVLPPAPPPGTANAATVSLSPAQNTAMRSGNASAAPEDLTDADGEGLDGEPAIDATAARGIAQKRARQDNMLTAYLMIFLIPYSLFATVIVIILYLMLSARTSVDPFEKMIDWPRESKDPYERFEKRGMFNRLRDDRAIPPKLLTPLGQPLQVGDLLATPKKVESRQIEIQLENTDAPQLLPPPALVLTMEVKNTSGSYSFAPNDLAFNRRWNTASAQTADAQARPYTALEVGRERFYGGPCDWWPRGKDAGLWRKKNQDPRYVLVGDHYKKMLKPGESTTILIATDPENAEVFTAINRYKGDQFVWRVQLRRGLVEVPERGEASATALLGITFTKDQIEKN